MVLGVVPLFAVDPHPANASAATIAATETAPPPFPGGGPSGDNLIRWMNRQRTSTNHPSGSWYDLSPFASEHINGVEDANVRDWDRSP